MSKRAATKPAAKKGARTAVRASSARAATKAASATTKTSAKAKPPAARSAGTTKPTTGRSTAKTRSATARSAATTKPTTKRPAAKAKTTAVRTAAKTKPAAAPTRSKAPAAPGAKFQTVDEFMAYAYGMEAEATERYGEFADQMEVHNNPEVAELFSKLARVEAKHRDQIMEQMGWREPPATSYHWEGPEGPETADITSLHYLMQPYHALKIAEHNERRAAAFFERLARSRVPAEVRAAAREMAEEEHEHVRLIRAWLAKVPEPEANWDEDPDPPALPE